MNVETWFSTKINKFFIKTFYNDKRNFVQFLKRSADVFNKFIRQHFVVADGSLCNVIAQFIPSTLILTFRLFFATGCWNNVNFSLIVHIMSKAVFSEIFRRRRLPNLRIQIHWCLQESLLTRKGDEIRHITDFSFVCAT